MHIIAASVLAVTCTALAAATPVMAAPKRTPAAVSTDLSAQDSARPRTRVVVTPVRRTGPLVRECDFRLVREVRASGTYVVPRERCWWTRQ